MIEVNIPRGVTQVTTPPLYQWDYGQKLRITGDDIPSICQVHFCDRSCDKTIVRLATLLDVKTIEVAIPDELLQNEWPINAFIFVVGEDEGKTLKHIHIPMIKRKQPNEYIETIEPSEQTQLEEFIASLNATHEEIQDLFDTALTYEEIMKVVDERTHQNISAYEERLDTFEEDSKQIKANAYSLEERIEKLEPEVITDFTNFNEGNPLNWTYTKNYPTNKILHNKVTVIGEIWNWSNTQEAENLKRTPYTFRLTFNIPNNPEELPVNSMTTAQYTMYETQWKASSSSNGENITVYRDILQVGVQYEASSSLLDKAYIKIYLEKFSNGDWVGTWRSDGYFYTTPDYVGSITKIILENE